MILTTIGGNPDLDPETADTVTAGIVVRPGFESPWVRDLQFTIDWYRIEIDDVVTFVDAGTAVLNCFDPTYNPAYAADNYWCTLFGRDPDTGEIVDAFETYRNLATQTTSGVDFQLDWSLPVGPGELGVGWYVGWLDEFELQTTSERACGAVRRNDRRLCRLVSRMEVAHESALRVARSRVRPGLALRRLDGRQLPLLQDDRRDDSAQGLLRPRRQLHDR